jgi:spore maturation protein A
MVIVFGKGGYMLNYIWAGMIIIGIITAIFTGKVELVVQEAIKSVSNAVELCIQLMGIMCLWSGLMEIAQKSGIVRKFSALIKPVLVFLFPRVPVKHAAMNAIVMNITANMLGLGNAATPLGLKAMSELNKLNNLSKRPSDAMCMFLILNITTIQLIPTTVIAIRLASGSANPAEIIGTIWVTSICAAITGIIAGKIFGKISFMKNKNY